MVKPNLVLTGYTGFVGAAVVRALTDCRGDFGDIWLAGRGGGELPAGMFGWPLDLRAEALELPGGVDMVIHLAGEKRSEHDMWRVNAEGTRKIVEAAAAAGVRRFVHLSSVGVYGAPVHSGLLDEDFPHHPVNVYEQTKDVAERSVRECCDKLGLEWIVLQPSNVIGIVPGKSAPLLGLIRALKRGRLLCFGRRSTILNYVAVEDVAVAVLHSIVTPIHGRTWIVNTPALLEDALSWIADELRISARVRRVPEIFGALAVRILVPLAALAGRTPPIDRARLRELTNTTLYDSSAIARESGFSYSVGAEQLFRSLAVQYREEGLL